MVGTLAAVEIVELPLSPGAERYHQAVLKGLTRRATERGFVVESFRVGAAGLSVHRLDSLLQERGIRGFVLLPVRSEPDLSGLDWSRYSAVYTDYLIERPPLTSVHPDRYRSMMALLERLVRLGYDRPGLILAGDDDRRVQHHWEGALLAFQARTSRRSGAVPVLKLNSLNREGFGRWFLAHRPTVVLGMNSEVISWMERLGGAVPDRQGFVSLNVLESASPCAGLDLQPELIGSGAIDLLMPSLYRNEMGVPEIPAATAIPARWVEGPTLRPHPFPAPPARGPSSRVLGNAEEGAG